MADLGKQIETEHDALYGLIEAITGPMTHTERQAFHKGREIGMAQIGFYLGVGHTVSVVTKAQA